jgi:hypothetical protein
VHEPADQRAALLAVQRVRVEVAGQHPDVVDVLRVGHQPGVEHVQLDVRGRDRRHPVHGEAPGVVVEPDADRRGEQVPPHVAVAGWRPGETPDAEHQLQLLRVAGGGDVGGEQPAVAGPHRRVGPFATGPRVPLDEPGDEPLGQLRGGVVRQHRRAVRVPPVADQRGKLVVRHGRLEPGDPLDREHVGVGLGIPAVRGDDGRVVGHVPEPQHGPVPVRRPRGLVAQLLGAAEELEQPNGPADQRVGVPRGRLIHPCSPWQYETPRYRVRPAGPEVTRGS